MLDSKQIPGVLLWLTFLLVASTNCRLNQIAPISYQADPRWMQNPGRADFDKEERLDKFEGISADADENLWLVSEEGFVYFYNQNSDYWQEFPLPFPAEGNTIHVAPDSDVWVGTDSGLFRRDAESDSWQVYGAEAGLRNENVRHILVDREGTIWTGTEGGGLFVSADDGATWQHVITEPGFSEFTTYDIYQDSRGDLWVAEGSLWRYRPGLDEWQVFLTPGKRWSHVEGFVTPIPEFIQLNQGGVFSIAEDSEGYMWFGTTGYVYRYDPQTDTWQTYPLIVQTGENIFRVSEFDTNGYLWLGAFGAYQFDTNSGEFVKHERDNGYTTISTRGIVPLRDGSIWFATHGDGVFKFVPE